MYKKGLLVAAIFLLFGFIAYAAESKYNIKLNNIDSKPIPKINAPKVQNYIFGYKNYEEIIKTFKEYEQESPELLEVYSYGKSSKNKDLNVIKISNERNPGGKIVLVTAGIHGNEPLSTSVTMSYMCYLLSQYGKDIELTKLIDETTIYYVPVVSPDSYPYSRHVDSVDPNRNFPTLTHPNKESILIIKNLQNLFLEIKPNSVLSCHTYGRLFLIPWGDSKKDCPDQSAYLQITKEMGTLSNYKVIKTSELYNRPIFGTENDWYYRNGSFSIVMELGTHQKKPSIEDTKIEFDRTIKSFIYFIKESTKIKLQIKSSF